MSLEAVLRVVYSFYRINNRYTTILNAYIRISYFTEFNWYIINKYIHWENITNTMKKKLKSFFFYLRFHTSFYHRSISTIFKWSFPRFHLFPLCSLCHWRNHFSLHLKSIYTWWRKKKKRKEKRNQRQKKKKKKKKRKDWINSSNEIISLFFVNCDFISGNSFHDQFLRIVSTF